MVNGKHACGQAPRATGEVCATSGLRHTGSPVHAVTIGARNAESAVGARYRWCRAFAAKHGVPVYRVGRKLLIDAPKFFAALAKFGDSPGNAAATPRDPVRALLAEFGMEVVT